MDTFTKVDPAKTEFCRALEEFDVGTFHREKLFEAIDRLIERRVAEAFDRAIAHLDKGRN